MIEISSIIVMILCAVVIAYQDFKWRAIHIALPIFLFASAFILSQMTGELTLVNLSYILGFIILNLICLVIYFSYKERKFVNPLKAHIGLGDILFFVAVAPIFTYKNYVVFFVSGMIFSLICYVLMNVKQKQRHIPLAGCLSLFFILVIIIDNTTDINFLNSSLI